MPALTLDSGAWLHIFRNTGNQKHKLSGFHSKCLIPRNPSEDDLVPRIKRRIDCNGKHAFYLCGWNYYLNKTTPIKWSTMFPDDWAETEVKQVVTDAVTYWNDVKVSSTESLKKIKNLTENSKRLSALAKSYHVHWVGQAQLRGKTFVIGGMEKDNKVVSGFPLMGANPNFPSVFGVNTAELNIDVDDTDA